ncbi:DMT family transporter [Salinicoccus halodurans]|uniref:Multidrug resistance protein EbrB n=1 Tax=Salinicoccus halodurans TaxID=407035 RepID=A0A0F7HM99_9STAP|nr:multidrug efflux SMR transporter [Salinicoccus halodurans]AKG74618.1 multidrug transporter [Salinicoccus halodurans]SFK89160.1 multidrug resistance protein EbrB [Salinicoccus halodurans]
MKNFMFLAGAIIFEVTGTTLLNLSDGFTNLVPTAALIISFALSFICLVYALKAIPLSLAYSIWAGLGTAGAGVIGVFLFDEVMTPVNIIGLLVIIAGVVIMNMSSGEKADRKPI